ncbi:MAG TPA: hypothetical protein VK788_12775 [Terriglobales bacterium]|nr:hypothetical protein [Terriglobales bacterium]
MPASLGVEQDSDFAVLLDRNGEVASAVMVEVAGGCGVAAVRADGFLNLDARRG